MTPTDVRPARLIDLPALGISGKYRARESSTIADVSGKPAASLSIVPALFVTRTMAALRKANILPMTERLEAISSATEKFASGVIAGLSPEEYKYIVCRVSGLPKQTVERSVRNIAAAGIAVERSIRAARPTGASLDWTDPLLEHGGALWVRRGGVFAVLAAGNSPGVHAAWLQALALGYRIAVRPSRREPFTPYRLITALREAGFGNDQISLLPTDHVTADEIVSDADLAMVYGGADVTRKYASRPNVLPQGPGRAKILVSAEVDWHEEVDMLVSSISSGGGTGCMSTSAIFVERDPTGLAQILAERLADLPSLPPEDEDCTLPVQPMDSARRIEQYLVARAVGTKAWLGGDGIVDELPDGSAVLRPAVYQLETANDDRANTEMAFPCVWVVPWARSDGIAPLRHSLALTAMTRDSDLVAGLIDEPTIANLNIGSVPTFWSLTESPHDDYLPSFLMRAKAFIRQRGSEG